MTRHSSSPGRTAAAANNRPADAGQNAPDNATMTDTKPTVPAVYSAISAVMGDLAAEGISKARRNQQQGYNFRGIDDVYNALAPTLARHRLLILPRVITRAQVERQTAKGGVLFYTTVEVEFDLVSGEDGSKHTIRTVGEAMDSADKSSNKAMSAAFKYAAMQAFCIPTEGDHDADATTHEVAPQSAPGPDPAADFAIATMRTCRTRDEFKDFWSKNKDGLKQQLTPDEYNRVVQAMRDEAARFAPAKDETPFDTDTDNAKEAA